MNFFDIWLWLILAIIGLLLALLELLIGVDAGLDLVFVGSSLMLGGVITWPFHSWVITLIVVVIICIAYVAIGRKYVHKWRLMKTEKTNVDAIISKHGVVLKPLGRNVIGKVRIVSEEWRATAEEDIQEGSEIEVLAINGVTLTVKKAGGQ